MPMPEQPQEPAVEPGREETNPAPAEDPAATAAPAPASDEKTEKKKKKKKEDTQLRIKGRAFVRDTISRDGWANDLSLASARVGAVYRDRTYGLRIEVEAELAGRNAEVRDAYVRLDANEHLRVQVGRFKRPMGAISTASRWALPVIERGYLNDLELDTGATREPDELPLGGRFVGATATLRHPDLPSAPELIIGVFRSPVHAQVAGSAVGARTPIGWSGQFPEDVFTRLEVEPLTWINVGASLAWVGQLEVAGERDTFRHGIVSSLDAVMEAGPFRGWFEAFMGTSPLHLTTDLSGNQSARGSFQAVRGIASGRWPVTDTVYVEPFVMFQLLNGSNELGRDRIIQRTGGLNVGVGEGWRVQAAVDYASVDPLLLYNDSTLFLVQLGTVF